MSGNRSTLREQLLQGKTVATQTSGTSMEPLLYDHKTTVWISSNMDETGTRRELQKGDILIYLRQDGKYVIHRLIQKGKTYYVTRGDNCITCEQIPKDWVLGVVTEIHRKGKNIAVNDKGYRLYVHLWCDLFPLRVVIRRCANLLRRVKRKLRTVWKKS